MNARLAHILKSPWTTHISIGAVGVGAGVGIGYILWGRQPEFEIVVPAEEPNDFELDFDTEGLAEARLIIDQEDYDRPLVMAPETGAEVTDNSVIVRPEGWVDDEPTPEPEEPEELIQVNVFEEQDEDWDWEAEVASRNLTPEGFSDHPYILHHDEFYRNERDYTQSTLTYYAGDDIMVDEADKPIPSHLKITGPLLWGHGSGNPESVLVRNDERKGEYEVILEHGRYEVEVLGYDYADDLSAQDLKHSTVRRFRDSD